MRNHRVLSDLIDGGFDFDENRLLQHLSRLISKPVIDQFVLTNRAVLEADDISIGDIVRPLCEQRWPRSELADMHWATSELLLCHHDETPDNVMLWSYLGALYLYCGKDKNDLQEAHLGIAVQMMSAAIESGALPTVAIFTQYAFWLIVNTRHPEQRMNDPLPALFLLSSIGLARVASEMFKATVTVMGDFNRTGRDSSMLLGAVGEESMVVMLEHARRTILGDRGLLEMTRSLIEAFRLE